LESESAVWQYQAADSRDLLYACFIFLYVDADFGCYTQSKLLDWDMLGHFRGHDLLEEYCGNLSLIHVPSSFSEEGTIGLS